MPEPASGHAQRPRALWRGLAYVLAAALLALVFLMYFKSQLVFDLATRLWSCF